MRTIKFTGRCGRSRFYKKLISRWDRRTLPFEPRTSCTNNHQAVICGTMGLQATACLHDTPQLTSECYL